MRTVRMIVELTYDETIMHDDGPDGAVWFNDLLTCPSDPLWITSDEIGDTLGTIEVIDILPAEAKEGEA